MNECSSKTREWIEKVWKAYPPERVPQGIRTGPVRLGFCNLLERPKPGKDGKERSHGVVLLFPDPKIPGVDLHLFEDAVLDLFKEKAPLALVNPALLDKYHKPLKKQESFIDTKTGELYDGFIPGRIAISANSPTGKPPVFNSRNVPIVDKSDVYSGCWGLAVVNPGWINRSDNPGPTFYLQGVMVIADDDNLGGAAPFNPQTAFGGVSIDAEVNPQGMFAGGELAEEAAKKALFG